MIWIGLILLVIAGIAEHYKDLSEEGKLKGYWDKNHQPMIYIHHEGKWTWFKTDYWYKTYIKSGTWLTSYANPKWWKVHWLQGPKWNWMPVWIRQYLSFRDGWHLLKFISLNSFALGIVLLTNSPWWWFILIRSCFSLPETILRKYPLIKYKK